MTDGGTPVEPGPEHGRVGVRKVGMGPLGWGLCAVLCNVAFVPTVLAVITGIASLRDLSRASPEQRESGAGAEAWLGVVLGLLWPLALTAAAVAAIVLVPEETWAEVREGFEEGFEQGFEGAEVSTEGGGAREHDILVLPPDHHPATPVPMLIWLHGYGSSPNLVYEAYFERLAEAYGIAVLGVSAPLAYEPEEGESEQTRGYVWEENVASDGDRVWDAIEGVADRVTPKDGRIVLFGFSQGAGVAAELAALHRGEIAGAIMMSPGMFKPEVLSGFKPRRGPPQRYVISVGAGEIDRNIASAETFRDRLKELEVQVDYRVIDDQDEHVFPDDFYTRLPRWLEQLLAERGGLGRMHSEEALVRRTLDRRLEREIAEGFLKRAAMVEAALEWVGPTSLADVRPIADALLEEKLAGRKELERSWPKVTDCDRLDRAFAAMERAGIVARQNFTDCGTCGAAEIGGEMEAARKAGLDVRGYTFYHWQDTESAVEGGGLYLNYGSAEEGDEAGEAIGREIVKHLEAAGLKTKWNGSIEQRIGIEPLDWKRRLF